LQNPTNENSEKKEAPIPAQDPAASQQLHRKVRSSGPGEFHSSERPSRTRAGGLRADAAAAGLSEAAAGAVKGVVRE